MLAKEDMPWGRRETVGGWGGFYPGSPLQQAMSKMQHGSVMDS